jgi:hypothetical protein
MVIELLCSRDLGDLVETEVVFVGLTEGKSDIDKIFTETRKIGHSFCGSECDHAFGGMYCNVSELLVAFCKMIKQGNGMRGFTFKKIGQHFIAARMRLICFDELLVA